jgi:flagellar motor switch protein FliM
MANAFDRNTGSASGKTEPVILACNFRSAGRLSNDSLRHLRNMHDSFARNLVHSLDLFLGSPLSLKLSGVEQITSRELTSALLLGGYLVPFTLMPMGTRVIVKLETPLLFPLLDVLLGGSGDAVEQSRELTDIDEELIRSVLELVGAQLERTWKSCDVSVTPSASLKPAMASQIFATEERVLSLHFEVTLGGITAGMNLVLPMGFCNALLRSSMPEAARRHISDAAGSQRLRDRVMDCSMILSAELQGARITVGELLSMRPGTILNLRTPVAVPVRLGVGSCSLFEMTPARRGGYKTAQLGASCPPSHQTRG